jgi:hypothetical protein
MTVKKKMLFLIPIVSIGLIIISSIIIRKVQSQRRQTLLTNLIRTLEDYKIANGTYPADLSKTITLDEDWLYYLRDSVTRSFTLTYTSGIMNCNTFRYSSETKKWKEFFNY